MMKILLVVLLMLYLRIPADAVEISAPEVPVSGSGQMPQHIDSFGEALLEMIGNSLGLLGPELHEAAETGFSIFATAMLFSFLSVLLSKEYRSVTAAGVAMIVMVIFWRADNMINYSADMVWEICEYGKLLCPVLTTALAAQGGITASAALYTGTTVFLALLNNLISKLLIPMAYMFLSFSIVYCAFGNDIIKNLSDATKSAASWVLKTLLIVFTTFMSITGVVSGTSDAAVLKTAKVAISTVVPIVGGILSDASESALIGIGVMKNAAGIYGILAVFAVCINPFLKVGVQYLMLKATAALCGIFGTKNISSLLDAFSTVMGLLLAMIASAGMLVLISTVCYLKGIR